jgi:hypothetical protein
VIPVEGRVRNEKAARGLLAAAFFVQVTSGCLSNEYRIPNDELRRLAGLPPDARGQNVRVVQQLGERRGDAIDPDEGALPTNARASEGYDDGNASAYVRVDGGAAPGHRAPGAFRGRPTARAGGGGAGWRAGGPRGGSGSPGGRGLDIGGSGGGGGGGNNGDALVVVAVLLVVVAAVAMVALAASEGARFDGRAQLAPDQPVYLEGINGGTLVVPLGALTPEMAAAATVAKVMDDEGAGMRRLDRAPLDRTGWAFRLDLGTGTFNFGPTAVSGPAAHIQVGGFVTPWLGFLVDMGLSGAGCACGPVLIRHTLALEVDALPVALGPVRAGLFGRGGEALAGLPDQEELGPVAGGGLLVEIALTSRLALTMRAGADAAYLASGWSSAGALTGGLTIY